MTVCGKGWLRDLAHDLPLTRPMFPAWVHPDDAPLLEPSTRFSELGNYHVPRHPPPTISALEDFSGEKFLPAYNKMSSADDDIAPEHTQRWNDIGKAIQGAANTFQTYVNGLRNQQGVPGDSRWQGKAAQAAADNAYRSLEGIKRVHESAFVMSILVDGFSRGVNQTKHAFIEMMGHYQEDTDPAKNNPHQIEDNQKKYDAFAVNTLNVRTYKPALQTVENNHPDLSGVAMPTLDGGAGPGTAPGFSGAGGGGGGQVGTGGLGSPDVPQLSLPDDAAPTGRTGPPSGGSGNPAQAAEQAGQAAQQAGQQAQNAAGQGANAAKQALDSALNAAGKGPGGLPEGVLGLGPKGLSGAAKLGGGGGARGGGGAATHTPTAKPAAQMAPPTKAAAAVPASRAGASAAGSPGAGAPAAGHRGGAAGTVHKASKALRNQKNGEEVAGETEAVVPVVGGEWASARAEPRPS
jgi:hypothetical protein